MDKEGKFLNSWSSADVVSVWIDKISDVSARCECTKTVGIFQSDHHLVVIKLRAKYGSSPPLREEGEKTVVKTYEVEEHEVMQYFHYKNTE